MTNIRSTTQHLNDFFIDKEKIKSYVEQLKDKTDTSPLTESVQQHIQQIEQRWQNYPIFTRSLAPYLEEIQQYNSQQYNTHQQINPHPPSSLSSESSPSLQKPQLKLVSPPHSPTAQPLPRPTAPLLHCPTPATIHTFFQSQNIVGEHSNQELLIYGTLASANIGIESLSGSGKSALLYALLEAFPKEHYLTIHQTTGKSLYNNPNINKTKYWIIPELQKVFTQDIEEIIKNLTEGIATTYTRTNSTKTGIDQFEIKKKSILYSFAITNSHLKHRDEEFSRRFIIINTDISKRQNQRIAHAFAHQSFQPPPSANLIETENKLFREHINHCLTQEKNNISTKNPFLPYLVNNLPPELTSTIRFRSALKHLNTLIQGSTLFYHSSLSTFEKESESIYFSSLFENQHTLSLYQSTLIANIYGLSVIDQALLSIMPDTEPLDYHTILEKVNEQYMINTPLEETITSLLKKNILLKEGNLYRLQPLPKIEIDWDNALAAADQLMQQTYPQHHDKWYERTEKQREQMK